MVRRLSIGKNNHLTCYSLAINPRNFAVCRHVVETLKELQAKMSVAQIGDCTCTFEENGKLCAGSFLQYFNLSWCVLYNLNRCTWSFLHENKCHNHSWSTGLPRCQKERWGTNRDNTNSTYETTDAQRKNCNERTALEWSVGKLLGRWGGEGLKPVLFTRSLTFNSDTALNTNRTSNIKTLKIFIYLNWPCLVICLRHNQRKVHLHFSLYTPFLLYHGSYFITEFAYLLISHLLRPLSVVYISFISGRQTTGSKKLQKWTNI